MKLLLKIYWNDINPYDLMQILDVINSKITDKESVKIYLMTNDITFDFEPYEFFYSSETSIPKMINMNLDIIDWDIVIPIYKPSVIAGFDKIIKRYSELFPNLDGVLLLNDTYPVIGKKYYEKFKYVYNPVYKYKHFDDEFMEVAKKLNKLNFLDNIPLKILDLKSDDNNIYEMRQRLNFGL
jgi:hypothetical protein